MAIHWSDEMTRRERLKNGPWKAMEEWDRELNEALSQIGDRGQQQMVLLNMSDKLGLGTDWLSKVPITSTVPDRDQRVRILAWLNGFIACLKICRCN